ncbi:hypothetical protein SAMN05421869_104496 [Nonomuraea jiangxiensis]|uniref:Uncharacterized protein n=1 Tax=Nonomuraea jiangxiensis TaxID=633440 RepID=A0A1G8IIV5_9ACTN|nr:hypothetical protein SAMN05421869_104496 [Nonomuraea jiangxiensis]
MAQVVTVTAVHLIGSQRGCRTDHRGRQNMSKRLGARAIRIVLISMIAGTGGAAVTSAMTATAAGAAPVPCGEPWHTC